MNHREKEIGEIATGKLTCFHADHLTDQGEITSATGRRNIGRWLAKQVRDGVLRQFSVFAKPTPPLKAPLYVGNPGEDLGEQEAAAISWRLEKRWAVEPVRISVFTAGRKCAQVFGGKDRRELRALSPVSHDLALASLYFRFVRTQPDRARDWVPDFMRESPGYGEKHPDVVLCDGNGTPYRAIEMGGVYSRNRLIGLQTFCCQDLRLPLEIW